MIRFLAVPFVLFLAASCGGSTFEQTGSTGGTGGQAGASGSGGTAGNAAGSGGSGAVGGSSGTGSGGSIGSGGAGSGGTGTGGAAGSGGQAGMPALCELPAEGGNCDAYMPSYFHDAATGLCKPFVYGGCGGNDNRFETLEACQAACHGGTPNLDACQSPSECTLGAVGCCGPCDQAEARDYVAFNVKFYAEYDLAKGCGDVQCGACPDFDELDRTSQYFAATCRAGECAVVDIRQSTATECSDDSECSLRDGASCCEGCDSRGIVAIRSDSTFYDLVCGGGDVACPACASQIPPDLKAACIYGRCQVIRP